MEFFEVKLPKAGIVLKYPTTYDLPENSVDIQMNQVFSTNHVGT